jgi:hypothetical protein
MRRSWIVPWLSSLKAELSPSLVLLMSRDSPMHCLGGAQPLAIITAKPGRYVNDWQPTPILGAIP